MEICNKFKIHSTTQLRQWIKKYNGHEELKTPGPGGTVLLLFMAVSWFTGGILLSAVFGKSPKSQNGSLESRAGFKGLCRKAMTLFYVLIAARLDALMGTYRSVMTTVNIINSMEVFVAVKDGANYYSVYPVGVTIKQWRDAGSTSIWTQTLKSIVVKWDGGR